MGTLRENLDCIGMNSDNEIKSTLAELSFTHPGYQNEGLEFKLDDSGTNLSIGEAKKIGPKSFVQGITLWLIVSVVSLVYFMNV